MYLYTGGRSKSLAHKTLFVGETPLSAASSTLDTGHKLNPWSATTKSDNLGLHYAVSRSDIGAMCYALLGGQSIDSVLLGLQPIHLAACQDDPAVLEFLLQNGADINAQTSMRIPHNHHPPTVQRRLLSQPQLQMSLQHSRGPGRQQLSPQNQRGLGTRKGIRYLKEFGASAISGPIKFTTGLYSMHSTNEEPCAPSPSPTEQPRFLAACADGSRYYGATPLHFAVANGHLDIAEYLVKNGALLDIPDSYGNTAEMVAMARHDARITHLLQLGHKKKPRFQIAVDTVASNGYGYMSPPSTAHTTPTCSPGNIDIAAANASTCNYIKDGSLLQFPSPDLSTPCFPDSLLTPQISPAYASSFVKDTLAAPCTQRRRKPAAISVVPVRRHTSSEAEPRTHVKCEQQTIRRRGTLPTGHDQQLLHR